jgi:hypothetical protein
MIDERTAVWIILALIVIRLMSQRSGYMEFPKPTGYDTYPWRQGSGGLLF